eukprot:IDg4284t1
MCRHRVSRSGEKTISNIMQAGVRSNTHTSLLQTCRCKCVVEAVRRSDHDCHLGPVTAPDVCHATASSASGCSPTLRELGGLAPFHNLAFHDLAFHIRHVTLCAGRVNTREATNHNSRSFARQRGEKARRLIAHNDMRIRSPACAAAAIYARGCARVQPISHKNSLFHAALHSRSVRSWDATLYRKIASR